MALHLALTQDKRRVRFSPLPPTFLRRLSYVTAKRNKGKLITNIRGVSNKFLTMCDLYLLFAEDWKDLLDFSDQMKVELYNSESYGTSVSSTNGYFVGKKYLNVQVTMWKEDIKKDCCLKKSCTTIGNILIGG